MNPLAGKPLRYRIGRENEDVPLIGADGELTEGTYDDGLPSAGIGVGYCNTFDQSQGFVFGPHLADDKVSAQYDERRVDPQREGWPRLVAEQILRRKRQVLQLIEWDNIDGYANYGVDLILKLYDDTHAAGLGILAKNPRNLVGSLSIVKHAGVVAVINELGAGSPDEMEDLRRRALRPDLPIYWVFWGSKQLATARAYGKIIKDRGYLNMSVTHDSTVDEDGNEVEYGGNIEDIVLPIVAAPSISPTPTQRPSMAVPPASNRIWRGEGNKRVAKSLLMLYDQVDSMLPSTRKAGNDGSVGDLSHQATKSDHNPNDSGIVTAIDITDDPASGFDADAFAESLRRVRDSRLKYVIWRGRIFGDEGYAQRNGATAYQWAERNKGPGDHSEHVHVSVDADSADDVRPWVFDLVNANSPTHSAATRPKIKFGDRGPAVVELQQLLGIEDDGFFGTKTRDAVKAFQASRGLFEDGVVGSHTWGLLTETGAFQPAAGLSQETISRITSLAASSALASYSWADRGRAPVGYIKGMAVAFAYVYAKWRAGESAARVMAALPTGDTERDALAWYGITNITAGPSTLRALFMLLIGLGMRESSGKYWEGLDTNAGFKSADETEAGLFQQSWNSRSASPELPKLFAAWSADPSDGFLSIFREGVPAGSSSDLGGGQGEEFQRLCKAKPAFAAEAAAVCLRVRRSHFGPINRREVEDRHEADVLLQQVQAIVDAAAAPPIIIPKPPEPPMPDPAAPQLPFDLAAFEARVLALTDQVAAINQSLRDVVAAAQQVRAAAAAAPAPAAPVTLPDQQVVTGAAVASSGSPTVASSIGVIFRAASKVLPMLGLQGGILGTGALWAAQAADVIGTAAGATATPYGGVASAGLATVIASSL